MSAAHRQADLAIIGGGAIGLAIAWRAARAGLDVVVADPAAGGGASHVAAGMLAPVAEAQFGESELLELNLESSRRWPAFAAELEAQSGMDIGFERCGSLLVARDADDLAAIERDHRFRRDLGLAVERLDGLRCRELEPALAPGIRGAVLAPDDGQVDPRRLVAALLTACGAVGVRFVAASASLCLEGGGACGVVCNGDLIRSHAVVIAAGAWSGRVAGLPADSTPPVHPVKGQVLRLHADGPPIVQHVIRGIDGYLVARRTGGSVIAGATVEERGFDVSVTAGAVYELLRSSRELVPDVMEMELAETSAGLRPGTPDNRPCIGETETPGLLVASGHHRNGILLTPVTADAVVAMLTDAATPSGIGACAPSRFAQRSEAGAWR